VAEAQRRQDELYARTPLFRRRLERAEAVVREACQRFERLAVSFSGGKDSLCVLDLVRRVVRPHVVFFAWGAEDPETVELVERTCRDWGLDLLVIEPARTILDIYRSAGALGYDGPADEGLYYSKGDMVRILIQDCAHTAIDELGLECNFLGLRKEEALGRKKLLCARGPLYYHKRDRCWHCNPIADWRAADVYAYIAREGLPLHPAYSKQRFCSRDDIRVASYACMTAASRGSLTWLKYYYPSLFNRFAAEFPEVRAYV
jgi:phosphoadenosine phosphosulfate reductase